MAINKKFALLPVLGLDPSKSAEYIDDRATPNCKNVSIDRYTIQKRLGGVQLGTVGTAERILAYRELYTNGAHNLIRVGLTQADSMNYGTGIWNTIIETDGDDLTANVTDRVDTAIPLESGTPILVFTNGIDPIQRWSGAGGNISDLGGAPNIPLCKYMIAYETYLVLVNVTSGGTNYPRRVQWNRTGEPEIWIGGNSGSRELTEDDGDATGVSIFGNYLCIHKETAIYLGYLVNTTSIFRFERKSTGVGTVCFATIQNLPTGDQAFLARDGIHLFNGISAPLIKSPIMDELRAGINAKYIYKCWSVVVEETNEYWVAVPLGSQTEPETIYKYNYMTGACHKDKRVGITAAGRFTATSQLSWADQVGTWQQATGRWDDITVTELFKTVVFGDTVGVSSKRMDTPNDISTAIDAFWESKDYQNDEIGRLCRWQRLQVWAKGDTLTVRYSIDSGSTCSGSIIAAIVRY